MRLGIFARTFPSGTPFAVMTAARDAGFGAVQWNMACSGLGPLPATIPAEAAGAVRAASEATGMEVAAVSATYNMIHPDPAARAAGRTGFAAIARAATAMGTRIVTLCSGTRDAQDPWRRHPDNASPEAWRDFRAELDRLLDLAERHGVMLGVEPEPGNVVSSPEVARRMLREAGSSRLGIVLDPANLFEDAAGLRGGSVVAEALEILGERVVLAHAKDRAEDGRIVPAGEGLVDFGRFLSGLQEAGFDGAVVTHGIEAAEAPAVARRLRATVEAL